MWKPGQIVTLSGKKYRLTKYLPNDGGACDICGHNETPVSLEPCKTCLDNWQMPYDCYPKEIKPKSVMG